MNEVGKIRANKATDRRSVETVEKLLKRKRDNMKETELGKTMGGKGKRSI